MNEPMQNETDWDIPHDYDDFGVDRDVVDAAETAEDVDAEMAYDFGQDGTYGEVYMRNVEDRYYVDQACALDIFGFGKLFV